MAKIKNKVNSYEDEIPPFKERGTLISQPKIEIDPKKFLKKLIKNDIKVHAKNESQKHLINSIKNNEIIIVKGKPGSGKTYIAVAYALSLLLKEDTPYNKINLYKSVAPQKGEEVGFIKGSLLEKIAPYMESFYINIEKLIGEENLNLLIENKIIRPNPLTFCRGITIDNTIMILDESQNVEMNKIKTLMTRIGENSKLIILGDVKQVDLVNKSESSLKNIIEMFKNTDKISVIEMNPNDVSVRNPLIDVIEAKFDEFDKENNEKRNKKQND